MSVAANRVPLAYARMVEQWWLLIPGLAAVINDREAEPLDRLFACLALTGWAEVGGYRAVAAAARGAGPPPWVPPPGVVGALGSLAWLTGRERDRWYALLVAAIFWGWMWGIVGVVLAVPILAAFKIFCSHIEPMEPLAEFLS